MTTKNIAYTVTILVASILTLKVILALLSAINDLPLLPSLFEIVGLLATGKFILTNIKAEQRDETISSISEKVEELGINDQVEAIKEVVNNVVEAVRAKSTNVTIPGWDKVDTSVPEGDEHMFQPSYYVVANPTDGDVQVLSGPFATEEEAQADIDEDYEEIAISNFLD